MTSLSTASTTINDKFITTQIVQPQWNKDSRHGYTDKKEGDIDGDQAISDQVNIPTIQPSQEKESKAQELAQVIKDIMAAQSAQNPAQQPGFVSLITQA